MAITFKGEKMVITGKDLKALDKECKFLGMSRRNAAIGMLWEYVMRVARERANALRD